MLFHHLDSLRKRGLQIRLCRVLLGGRALRKFKLSPVAPPYLRRGVASAPSSRCAGSRSAFRRDFYCFGRLHASHTADSVDMPCSRPRPSTSKQGQYKISGANAFGKWSEHPSFLKKYRTKRLLLLPCLCLDKRYFSLQFR